ncbi:sulfotransferase 1E1-like [Pieris napi]|uniref:sulfotransferase 1E1-like n=1 Tax=Pieris napi TaxID=78633 RepID=UPI001FBBF0F8|nr:sulfotransferase 1E1-like [Pieris napi]
MEYPLEIRDVQPETNEAMMKLFIGERGGFVRVGPKGYVLTQGFRDMAAEIYNLEVRPSDVYVVTYARSGTTWTQELVWLVANNLDYETAKSVLLTDRFPFIESTMMFHPKLEAELEEIFKNDEVKLKQLGAFSQSIVRKVAAAPSPRFIKTHLPLSLLSPKVLDAKVVYVARDPRDAAVSFYYLCRSLRTMGFDGDFKTFWHYFINDLNYWTPFFEHLKEAWEKRQHPNLLFLFYEDLKKDLGHEVRRVCKFLGKQYTDDQIAVLCDHLDIKNFKNNASVNNDILKELGMMYPKEEFIRKGKSGGWRDYFDEEMTAQADKWMEENLRDTDLRFPHLQ